ncbi:MAG TPA: zinc ribbon domain-containing protein [Firmicutes bacterium]|nr:zinc ribbon domain-containing protein [Bacillota bacterium]
MPVYEFRCGQCQEKFEELISWSQIDKVVCPKCGSNQVKKLVSTFAARSSDGQGSTSIGGHSSCGSCAGGSCSTCGH